MMPNDLPLPQPMKRLKVFKGYSVPFFVQEPKPGADPDFRVMSTYAMMQCIQKGLCWISGAPVKKEVAFVGGPISAIMRNYAEPPSIPECAVYAAQICPFMVNPEMRHRKGGEAGPISPLAGTHVEFRIPITAIVITRKSQMAVTPQGPIWLPSDIRRIEWFHRGRPATPEEISGAIDQAAGYLRQMYPNAEPRINEGLSALAVLRAAA